MFHLEMVLFCVEFQTTKIQFDLIFSCLILSEVGAPLDNIDLMITDIPLLTY